ncbi:hypothetical protein FMM58_05590 [Campylobacter sp. LR291e]|nr:MULTISPECIES: hypothetical protein [unclassified Campylobacter]KAA6226715.1 hypothetical protein FMM55_03960 [Campylobacter sp. LR196d]KAA6228689.1 hypothetical protein FMM54_00535 [Campylobacter sp. LR185c]KAA6229092.1 hypothetical protein FMM57_01715 [Campylobacter sp. LR286c]KAA6230152.1 hypothetical protein FMM58_05590 [Campylobacter sp. LR291e]KAA8604314.1 hypothetical protein CGP82_03780 [Campylobacter sp. LR185c]
MNQTWTHENYVDDFVKANLSNLGLVKGRDFYEKRAYSPYLKEVLQGASKTAKKRVLRFQILALKFIKILQTSLYLFFLNANFTFQS